MAIIKFDSEKVDTLIRDLNRISSDIESNLGKVYNNSYGKEISLTDSRLKVYAYRNKTIDVTQEDGTVVQEIVREKYLKNDFVANARLFNKHVRSLYNRSNSAKTKATQSIESVVNSLNKVKALISEYESEHSLRMSSNLDDVGQFNFNFLAAYGPMGRTPNFSHSFGTVVADDAYTSLYLGMLGERPTSLNIEKLDIFDGVFEIAGNNELTYQEKFDMVQGLLMENVLDVDRETLVQKATLALESMIGIAESPDIVIDDTLKIENLVRWGVPVIENYDGNLAIDLTTVDGVIDRANLLGRDALTGRVEGADLNIDTNGDGIPTLELGGSAAALATLAVDGLANHKPMASQLGISSNVDLDVSAGGGSGSTGGSGPSGNYRKYDVYDTVGRESSYSASSAGSSSTGASSGKAPAASSQPELPKEAAKPANNDHGPKNSGPSETPVREEVRQVPKQPVDNKPVENVKNDIIENKVVEKPVFHDEIKPSAEDVVIDNEIQSIKIDNNYNDIEVTESSVSTNNTIEIDDTVEKKGAGVLAGAAGIGALSKMTGGSSSVPQVNGMAAGELLGINTGSDAASMGMIVGNTTTASASTANVSAPSTTTSSVGGESTSDRGSLNNNSTSKTNTSSSGNGGSTLEDKDGKKDENSFGKPNKPGENEETTKKGLLGDASIAELDAKDEKDIKVATSVTAATAVTSGVLAIFNVLPWLMLLLALIAIGAYTGYRIKKKKDKEKRAQALAAQKAQEAANATVTMEAVQNLSDVTPVIVEESVAVETTNVAETVAVQPVEVQSSVQESVVVENQVTVQEQVVTDNQPVIPEVQASSDEFSSQPYEPSRDGMTEIGGTHSGN